MLPNGVLHKKNGHRQLPRAVMASLGDLVRPAQTLVAFEQSESAHLRPPSDSGRN
jgi:hypothetical protein